MSHQQGTVVVVRNDENPLLSLTTQFSSRYLDLTSSSTSCTMFLEDILHNQYSRMTLRYFKEGAEMSFLTFVYKEGRAPALNTVLVATIIATCVMIVINMYQRFALDADFNVLMVIPIYAVNIVGHVAFLSASIWMERRCKEQQRQRGDLMRSTTNGSSCGHMAEESPSAAASSPMTVPVLYTRVWDSSAFGTIFLPSIGWGLFAHLSHICNGSEIDSPEDINSSCSRRVYGIPLLCVSLSIIMQRPRYFMVASLVPLTLIAIFVPYFMHHQHSGMSRATLILNLALQLACFAIIVILKRSQEVEQRAQFKAFAERQAGVAEVAEMHSARRAYSDSIIPPVLRNRLLSSQKIIDVSNNASCIVIDVVDVHTLVSSSLVPGKAALLFAKFQRHLSSLCSGELVASAGNDRQRSGIQKAASIGDTFIGSCNLLTACDQHAVECLLFAKLVHESYADALQMELKLPVRYAIDSGQLIGAVTSDKYVRYDLFGQAVIGARKLLVFGKGGFVNMSSTVCHAILPVDDIEPDNDLGIQQHVLGGDGEVYDETATNEEERCDHLFWSADLNKFGPRIWTSSSASSPWRKRATTWTTPTTAKSHTDDSSSCSSSSFNGGPRSFSVPSDVMSTSETLAADESKTLHNNISDSVAEVSEEDRRRQLATERVCFLDTKFTDIAVQKDFEKWRLQGSSQTSPVAFAGMTLLCFTLLFVRVVEHALSEVLWKERTTGGIVLLSACCVGFIILCFVATNRAERSVAICVAAVILSTVMFPSVALLRPSLISNDIQYIWCVWMMCFPFVPLPPRVMTVAVPVLVSQLLVALFFGFYPSAHVSAPTPVMAPILCVVSGAVFRTRVAAQIASYQDIISLTFTKKDIELEAERRMSIIASTIPSFLEKEAMNRQGSRVTCILQRDLLIINILFNEQLFWSEGEGSRESRMSPQELLLRIRRNAHSVENALTNLPEGTSLCLAKAIGDRLVIVGGANEDVETSREKELAVFEALLDMEILLLALDQPGMPPMTVTCSLDLTACVLVCDVIPTFELGGVAMRWTQSMMVAAAPQMKVVTARTYTALENARKHFGKPALIDFGEGSKWRVRGLGQITVHLMRTGHSS